MPSRDDLTGGQFQHREYRDLKPAPPKPGIPPPPAPASIPEIDWSQLYSAHGFYNAGLSGGPRTNPNDAVGSSGPST